MSEPWEDFGPWNDFGDTAVDESSPVPLDEPSWLDVPRSSEELAQKNFEAEESLRRSGVLSPPTRPLSLSEEITRKLIVSPQEFQDASEVVKSNLIARNLQAMGIDVPREKVLADVAGGRQAVPSPGAQIASGVQNTAAELIGGLTDPTMAAPIAAGALFPPIAPLVSAGFGAHMLSQVPELAREAGRASVEGTPYEKAKAYSGLGATAAFVPATAAHAATPFTRRAAVPERTPDALQQEAAGTIPDVLKPEVTPEGTGQVPSSPSSAKAAEARVEPASIAQELDMTFAGETPVQVPGMTPTWDFRFKRPGVDMFSVVVKAGTPKAEILKARDAKIDLLQELGEWKLTPEEVSQNLNEIQTAVRIGGKEFSSSDKGHMAIAKETGDPNWITDVQKPENQGFMYKGKFISREKAARLIGETEPLQSERLFELRKKKTGGEIQLEKEKEEARVLETVPEEVRDAVNDWRNAEKRYRRARRQEPSDVESASESREGAEMDFRAVAEKHGLTQEMFDQLRAVARETDTEAMPPVEALAPTPQFATAPTAGGGKRVTMWSSSSPKEGMFLSDRKADAESYSMGRESNQYEVSVSNPFDPDTSKDAALVRQFDKLGGIHEAPQNANFRKALKSKGYDGIIGGEKGFGGESNWIIPLDKSQVRLVRSSEPFAPVPQSIVPPAAGGALPPTVPPGPTGGAPAAPVPPTPPPAGTTIADVYQRFEPIPKSRTPLKEIVPKVVEAVRTGMASKFRPIDKLAEDIGKSYGATTPKNLSGIFEQLKGSTGKGEADIYRFDRDVSSKVKGSEKDFNAYMFLRRSLDRLNKDLEDIQRAQAGEEVPTLNRRSVAAYTIPELEAKLQLLESNLGSEKVAQFQEAAQQYQGYMDNALRLQVESGRMSPEIYQAIKEGNEFYAPFKVMKYFEDIAQPEGSGRKIDTVADYTKAMVGIEDQGFRLGDMLGAARQNILISRILADKNNAMRKLAQLAEFDPDGVFIRRIAPGSEFPKDLSAVNVKENGKTVQYAVNKDVAEAIQSMGPNTENILIQMMGYAAIPMKAGATSLNIPFQVSNLLADVPRQALVSKFGVKSAADLVRYPMDFVRSAYAQIAGEVFKSDSPIFLDFLDSGAAGATVQEYLTPGALRFRPSGLEKTSKDFAKSVIYALPDFAKAIEQISKSVGVQRAMREHGVTSGKELSQSFPEAITEIRRFSGSPDFGRQGKWVEQARLNLLYMFFNARLQGTTADLGRLAGRDGGKIAASTWAKLAAAVGTPTLYLYALNHSDEFREDYLKRPEQERQNYWLIPKDTFITNEQGEKIRDYWRIPKRESAKWLANFTESALNYYNQKNPEQLGNWMEAALTDISPVNIHGDTLQERMESMASSLNPVIKAPFEIATGRDLFRHRDIIPESMQKASPEQQYIERTPEVFRVLANAMPDVAPEVFRSPMMIENMVKNFTAGMVTQFLPRKPIEGRSDLENNPLLQRFQAVPYTDSSEFENRMKFLERDAADVQLERYRAARTLIEEGKGKPIQDTLQKAFKQHGPDEKLLRRVVDLYVADQRGINSEERRVLALPVQQRAQFIADEIRRSTPEQKGAIIREYATKRILTEEVAAELAKLLAPAPPR